MVAAGEVDVERRDPASTPRLDMGGDGLGRALGVGGGELAAGVAGAGDEPGAAASPWSGEAQGRDGGDAHRRFGIGHAGDQQVLPDGEADIAIAESRGRLRARPRICAAVILPLASTTPTQLRPGWLLRMHADMGQPVDGRARL